MNISLAVFCSGLYRVEDVFFFFFSSFYHIFSENIGIIICMFDFITVDKGFYKILKDIKFKSVSPNFLEPIIVNVHYQTYFFILFHHIIHHIIL